MDQLFYQRIGIADFVIAGFCDLIMCGVKRNPQPLNAEIRNIFLRIAGFGIERFCDLLICGVKRNPKISKCPNQK